MATLTQSNVENRQQWQAYIDEELRDVDVRAPPPVLDQSTPEYLRAVCRNLKYGYLPAGHALRAVKFDKTLPNDALFQLVPQVVGAAKEARNDPSTVPPGEFREIVRVDPRTGYKEHRFVGQQSFVKQMTVPGRRVVRFCQAVESVANYFRGNERMREVVSG